jgi:hypothetical protein
MIDEDFLFKNMFLSSYSTLRELREQRARDIEAEMM